MSNCINPDEFRQQATNWRSNNSAPTSNPFSGDFCNPISVPRNTGQIPVPFPGGSRIQVEMIISGSGIRAAINSEPYTWSDTRRILVASNTSNDFVLLQPEVTVFSSSRGRSSPYDGIEWGYGSRNEQFATLENSEGVRVFIGTLVTGGITVWWGGGAGFNFESGSRTLVINGAPYEPFRTGSGTGSEGGNNGNDDEDPPPPCDIRITSNFDAGYFCMTFEEYNRFINDINRVEENLRSFQ
ncbi:MAG TPA: hypothetical protein DCE56_06620 [Cyanobacteria bacterium UBA8553]|nr:hypothetical protein [Cyanobacteria bacterium UBA8553]